ncbi:MAG: apolipoprotein N-acyltransferase [Planctomycetota bacterium]|nr:apolipoprotein N-acyltransferase [Planctomycetota bacterium]
MSRPLRLGILVLAFAFLWLASPGIVTDNGLWPLALLGVACWARAASAPGRWAAGIEFLCASVGWGFLLSWGAEVAPQTMLFIGPGHGLYFLCQGWALRRLRAKLPLVLAAPAAWMLFETLRAMLEPPFGLSWMRLGTYLNDTSWIVGSARVWGTGGLSLALAALGGAIADLWERRSGGKSQGTRAWPIALGLLPFVGGIVLTRLVPAPATVDGPRVLLVQPGFEQKRKQSGQAGAMMREQIVLTAEGLAAVEQRGEPAPDLVCWAETMLRIPIVADDLPQALEAGAKLDSWRGDGLDAVWARRALEVERDWIDGLLFGAGKRGGEPVIPPGTRFVSGAEYLRALDGRVRFQNAALLWNGPGEKRVGPAAKLHLVPGAETMLGLEHLEPVRNVILELAGYIPDFLGPVGDDPVLSFSARDGRHYRFGIAVCFDNAFDDAFTGPVKRSDVDFHLVVSNEAWFERTQETEQMLAFSRLAAISSGRSVVRATQSGTSIVFGPDGREVARLVDAEGEDEMVRGTLYATVPVPVGARSPFEAAGDGHDRPAPIPYVRLELLWLALWTGLPLLALLWALRAAPRRLPGNEPG